ncbi:MAG: diguanylate cyclase domain-containing protein, partial [Actinomycetes bacterium]
MPPEDWQWRHHVVVVAILAGAVGTAAFAALDDHVHWAALAGSLVPFLLAAVVLEQWATRRVRAALASAALILIAILAVHVFGTIEAHFLFFIMIPLVALYEDWVPFATAAALVIVHHGLAALADPSSVYNHPDALQSPVKWSLIHVVLFLAMCAASVVHWNANERTRTVERATRDQLRWLSLHDPLTGLANRVAVEESLEAAFAEAHPERRSVALLIIDIDGFKQVNDTLGHAAGDRVLQDVAGRLRACVRPGDTVGRMGGDEFAIVLPGADQRAASTVAQRIVARIASSARHAGIAELGVSVGGAVSTADTPEALMQHADLALYAAKRSGRGRFISYSPVLAAVGHDSLLVDVADARAWA